MNGATININVNKGKYLSPYFHLSTQYYKILNMQIKYLFIPFLLNKHFISTPSFSSFSISCSLV